MDIRSIIGIALAALAVTAAIPAQAHGGRDRWEERSEERWEHRDRGWKHGHWKHRHHHREVIRERIIVREPPPVVYERRVVYERPYYRDPAVVIGVDIPPLVIPLR